MESQTIQNREVTVNVFGGKRVRRIAIEELQDVITVCKKEEFEAAKNEKRLPITVGIRKKDVEF